MTDNRTGICGTIDYGQSKIISKAYEEWVCECVVRGYKGWLVTIMFEEMGDNQRHILENIKRELSGFYGRTITRFNRRPRSKTRTALNPIFIACPDRPVLKRGKINLDDVRINNGLHAHGIMLTNGTARKGRQFDDDVAMEYKYYKGKSNIMRINVLPASHSPHSATSYTLKGLVRGYFDSDDVQIFPRTVSELPSLSPLSLKGGCR